jgi:hypothetical protein
MNVPKLKLGRLQGRRIDRALFVAQHCGLVGNMTDLVWLVRFADRDVV